MKISARVFSFLSNEQLKSIFESAVSALQSGTQIVSWSCAGTSVSKSVLETPPEQLIFFCGCEISRRKAAGTFPEEDLPHVPSTISVKSGGVSVPVKIF